MANQSEGFVHLWSTPEPGDLRRAEVNTGVISFSFATGAKQRQTVSVSGGGFNALTVPTGAKAIAVKLPTTGSTNLTLKGVTGDTGIKLDATLGVPLVTPLGSSPSIGITSTLGGPIDVEVYWF